LNDLYRSSLLFSYSSYNIGPRRNHDFRFSFLGFDPFKESKSGLEDLIASERKQGLTTSSENKPKPSFSWDSFWPSNYGNNSSSTVPTMMMGNSSYSLFNCKGFSCILISQKYTPTDCFFGDFARWGDTNKRPGRLLIFRGCLLFIQGWGRVLCIFLSVNHYWFFETFTTQLRIMIRNSSNKNNDWFHRERTFMLESIPNLRGVLWYGALYIFYKTSSDW